jgi:hypothetical protein
MEQSIFIQIAVQTASNFGINPIDFEKTLLENLNLALIPSSSLFLAELNTLPCNDISNKDVQDMSSLSLYPKSRIKYTSEFLLKFKTVQNKIPKGLKGVEGLLKDLIPWTPNKNQKFTSFESKIKSIKNGLNKLGGNRSQEDEEKLISKIVEPMTEDCLSTITPFIFEKGIWDAVFRPVICKTIVKINDKFNSFKKMMLDECQKEIAVKIPDSSSYGQDFNGSLSTSTSVSKMDLSEDSIEPKLSSELYPIDLDKITKRRLNSIHFISELLKIRFFNPNLVLLCFDQLLLENKELTDLDIFHSSELLSVTYSQIQNPSVQKKFDKIFDKLKLEYRLKLCNKTKFRIEDTFKKYNKCL